MADQLFHRTEYQIQELVAMANRGTLGLPDLQREFVWKPADARDLLDSMMKGYPIGFVILWDSQNMNLKSSMKSIGNDYKKDKTSMVIIDGQQRITSLYAIITGKEVGGNDKKIKIAFNPLERKFAVQNASIEKDPEWISNISDVFKNENNRRKYRNDFIERLEKNRIKNRTKLSENEVQKIEDSIDEVLKLKSYIISALVINNDVSEEFISDIFTRVNSGGTKLNENDFILTLMSVTQPELRDKIEEFCSNSSKPTIENTSYNKLIDLKPSEIIRVVMSFVFNRARLKYAYMELRGSNFKRGANKQESYELKEKNFNKLSEGLDRVLNLDNWKGFLKAITSAGFLNQNMISSDNTLIYSYLIFLIGKYRYNIDSTKLRKIVARWFYMTSTTSHYTGSFEGTVQSELNDIELLESGEEFEKYINDKIKIAFNDDYFKYILPNNLTTSAANPACWNTYLAALNIFNVKVLFSDLYYRELLTGDFNSNRTALERHHLFPKAYLTSCGIEKDVEKNQIANFAYIEWETNMEILDNSPEIYFKPVFEKNTRKDEREYIMHYNALPENWYNMTYQEFLNKRRIMMADIIKEGYEYLMK